MELSVFDAFPESIEAYTFLEIKRNTAAGDIIQSRTESEGIIKIRNGMTVANNQEMRETSTTLHIYPYEPFIDLVGGLKYLVGNGIQHNGADYEITGVPGGENYEIGEREHLRLTLGVVDYSDFVYNGS